jgi:hypothetical protein
VCVGTKMMCVILLASSHRNNDKSEFKANITVKKFNFCKETPIQKEDKRSSRR